MEQTGIRARHRYDLRAGHGAGAIALLSLIEGLRESSFPDLAVTAYIPVPEAAGWGLPSDALRDLAALRRPELAPAELEALDRELPRLRRALEGEWRGAASVLAIGHRPLRLVAGMPEVAGPTLTVGRTADLDPLERQLADHQPALLVVADKETARIYARVLDRLTKLASLRGLPIHHHRQGGTSAEQWQRKQDEHTRHNLRLVARRLEQLTEFRPGRFGAILLAAPPEASAELIRLLPEHLRSLVREEPGLAAYEADGELRHRLQELEAAAPVS